MGMLPARVEITEVGTRDGLQAEAQFVPTARKIAFIYGFIAAGLRRIEATSFVSPRAVPQLADAAEVVAGVRRRGAVIAALVPNAKGAERAIAAGVDEMMVFISASESHSRTNLNTDIAGALRAVGPVAELAGTSHTRLRGAIAVAFGCPYEGDVAPARVVEVARALADIGITSLTLGDTTGMASPRQVEEVVGALRQSCPDTDLTLHFHNTRGLGLVNVMAGLNLGITRFESSIAGLGGCPFATGATGNVCTEDMAYLMAELGIDTGIDLAGLAEVARDVERALGRTLPGQIMRAGPRWALHPLDGARRALG